MLTADCAPSLGGIGHHVDSLSSGLRAAGYDVRIFDLRTLNTHRAGRNILASLFMGPAVERWIAACRIDIVHVHGGPGGVLPTHGWGNTPLIITANHTYAQQAHVPGQYWKWIFVGWERRGYRLADRVVCISPGTRDDLVGRYGIDERKVSVAECGFDLAPWIAADRNASERRRCIFVGRPDMRKGWDVLCQAWPRIRAACPEAVLDVVGFAFAPLDGIVFHGRLSPDLLRAMVGSSRLLLAPSRIEGFGLAAAEAIAAGTPVVGCDVSGLRTTVTYDRTGLLPPPDARRFADAVIGLLRDPAHWERLHAGCRADRARFDAAREVAAYEAAYAAVYSPA